MTSNNTEVKALVLESVDRAKSLYEQFKGLYGNETAVDQAILMVDHWLKNQDQNSDQFIEEDVIEFSMSEALDIEVAALSASQALKTSASRDKYERINEILSCLRVLLECGS